MYILGREREGEREKEREKGAVVYIWSICIERYIFLGREKHRKRRHKDKKMYREEGKSNKQKVKEKGQATLQVVGCINEHAVVQ